MTSRNGGSQTPRNDSIQQYSSEEQELIAHPTRVHSDTIRTNYVSDTNRTESISEDPLLTDRSWVRSSMTSSRPFIESPMLASGESRSLHPESQLGSEDSRMQTLETTSTVAVAENAVTWQTREPTHIAGRSITPAPDGGKKLPALLPEQQNQHVQSRECRTVSRWPCTSSFSHDSNGVNSISIAASAHRKKTGGDSYSVTDDLPPGTFGPSHHFVGALPNDVKNSAPEVRQNTLKVHSADQDDSLRLLQLEFELQEERFRCFETQYKAHTAEIQATALRGMIMHSDVENKLTTILDHMKCAICYNVVVETTSLNCEHIFCSPCIGRWRPIRETCPICRQTITSSVNLGIVDTIAGSVQALVSSEKEKKRRVTQLEAAHAASTGGTAILPLSTSAPNYDIFSRRLSEQHNLRSGFNLPVADNGADIASAAASQNERSRAVDFHSSVTGLALDPSTSTARPLEIPAEREQATPSRILQRHISSASSFVLNTLSPLHYLFESGAPINFTNVIADGTREEVQMQVDVEEEREPEAQN